MSGRGTTSLQLRPAASDDAEQVFAWRNRPEIVALGSSQRAVSWEEHQRWFAASIAGAGRSVFILLVDGKPAGQIRFDWMPDATAEVSLYLLAEFTGRGLGVQAIRQGCSHVWESTESHEIVAWIRAENTRSLAAFQKSGFVLDRDHHHQRPGHVRAVAKRPLVAVGAGAGAQKEDDGQ